MRTIYRQWCAVFLAGILCTLTACTKQEPNSENQNASGSGTDVAMGRYVEEQNDLPEDMGRILSFTSDAQGTLTLVGTQSPLIPVGPWLQFSSSDGGRTWTKDVAAELAFFNEDIISDITRDAQGNTYVLHAYYSPELLERIEKGQATPEETPKNKLTRVDSTGNLQDLSIEWESMDGQPIIQSISCAPNGDFLVTYMNKVVSYDSQTMQKKYELVTINQANTRIHSTFIVGNRLIALCNEGDLLQVDLDTGTMLESIPNSVVGNSTLLCGDADGKAIYLCSSAGIYRYILGGSVWEQIVDGELTSMNMPSMILSELCVQPDGSFTVLADNDSDYLVLRYRYDETVPTTPQSALTVYALEDNSTVRQAIGLYQREHPDVRIQFSPALMGDSAITKQDAIRALNTELMAGKGPDILVLDSLPIQKFAEKGVLADLSDRIDARIQSGELLENIVTAFRGEDGLMAVPARFAVPMICGTAADVDKANSLSALADWSQQYAALGKGAALSQMHSSDLLRLFYSTCAPVWNMADSDEGLKVFLEDIKRIADTSQEFSELGENANLQWGMIDFARGIAGMAPGISQTPLDIAVVDAIAKKVGDSVFAPMPGQAQKVFVPQTILGVNRNCKEPEKAKDFIDLVLSANVLNNNFDDGYAVETAALKKSMESPYLPGDDGMQFVIGGPDGSMSFVLQVIWPEEAVMESVYQMLESLETPFVEDAVLLQMIEEESRGYFEGSKTLDEAAAAIQARVKTYLSE